MFRNSFFVYPEANHVSIRTAKSFYVRPNHPIIDGCYTESYYVYRGSYQPHSCTVAELPTLRSVSERESDICLHIWLARTRMLATYTHSGAPSRRHCTVATPSLAGPGKTQCKPNRPLPSPGSHTGYTPRCSG